MYKGACERCLWERLVDESNGYWRTDPHPQDERGIASAGIRLARSAALRSDHRGVSVRRRTKGQQGAREKTIPTDYGRWPSLQCFIRPQSKDLAHGIPKREKGKASVRVGMLWFDGNRELKFGDRIERASRFYSEKYGRQPNVCLVNPRTLPQEAPGHVGSLKIGTSSSVLPNHFYIGMGESGRTSKK